MPVRSLDGSSNIDVNVSIGTIFSVFRRVSELGKPATREDFPARNKPGCGRLRDLRILYHACICNKKGCERVYTRSVDRGVYVESS